MIWVAFIVLVVVALALLLRPLLRAPRATEANASELAVYRDQLEELEADLARGLISPTEIEAARTEIKRKILSVATPPASSQDTQHDTRFAVIAVTASVPAFAVGIYAMVGAPNLSGSTFSEAAAILTGAGQTQQPDVETMVARLADRLKRTPGDARGWRMLGWSYAHLDRFDDAAKAFERAVALDGTNAELRAQHGEAMVQAAGGSVTPQAEATFDGALAIDPKEPRALFFRGLALEQRNKSREALAVWMSILRDGRADAAWTQELRQRASALALKLKLDPAKELPSPPPPAQASLADPPAEESNAPKPMRGPTAGDVAAAAELSPAEQQAMIAGMVTGLEERLRRDPNDLEGWLMLARSRKVMGDANAARTALMRAKELFGENPQARAKIAETANTLGLN